MKDFKWQSIGFIIQANPHVTLDLASFKNTLSLERTEQLLNLELITFYHPIHHITIDTVSALHHYISFR